MVPPQQLNPSGAIIHIEIAEGYIDKVEWPKQLARYRDFFTAYEAKITAQRPANIHTIERYLLLAGDLPGLEVLDHGFAAVKKHAKDASTLVVEVTEKLIGATAHIDNRGTPARGPFEYLGSATINNLLGQHEAPDLHVRRRGAAQRAQLCGRQLQAGAEQRRSNLLRRCKRRLGLLREPRCLKNCCNTEPSGPMATPGSPTPSSARAREQFDALRTFLRQQQRKRDVFGAPFNDDRLRGLPWQSRCGPRRTDCRASTSST